MINRIPPDHDFLLLLTSAPGRRIQDQKVFTTNLPRRFPLAFVAQEYSYIGACFGQLREDCAAGSAVCGGKEDGHGLVLRWGLWLGCFSMEGRMPSLPGGAVRSGPCAGGPLRIHPRRQLPPYPVARGFPRCSVLRRDWCVFPDTSSWARSAAPPRAGVPLLSCV